MESMHYYRFGCYSFLLLDWFLTCIFFLCSFRYFVAVCIGSIKGVRVGNIEAELDYIVVVDLLHLPYLGKWHLLRFLQ